MHHRPLFFKKDDYYRAETQARTAPYCGEQGPKILMMRHHFQRCPARPKSEETSPGEGMESSHYVYRLTCLDPLKSANAVYLKLLITLDVTPIEYAYRYGSRLADSSS